MHLDTLKLMLSNGKKSREVETLREEKEKDLLKTVYERNSVVEH